MKQQFSEHWVRENQDPYLLRKALVFAKILSWISGIACVAILLLRKQNLFLSLFCVAVPILCLVLDGLFPAYFTLNHTQKEVEREDYAFRASLAGPVIVGVISVALATMTNIGFFQYRYLILYAILFGLLAGALSYVLIPEYEVNSSNAMALILLFVMFGWGYIGQANYYLDRTEPEVQVGTIIQVERNRTRKGSLLRDLSGNAYTVTVRLPDGTEVTFGGARKSHFMVGAEVPVEIRQGGLGIRIYIIDRDRIYRKKGMSIGWPPSYFLCIPEKIVV